ncbi:hypothetical protein Emed_003300 [Eimeria media]
MKLVGVTLLVALSGRFLSAKADPTPVATENATQTFMLPINLARTGRLDTHSTMVFISVEMQTQAAQALTKQFPDNSNCAAAAQAFTPAGVGRTDVSVALVFRVPFLSLGGMYLVADDYQATSSWGQSAVQGVLDAAPPFEPEGKQPASDAVFNPPNEPFTNAAAQNLAYLMYPESTQGNAQRQAFELRMHALTVSMHVSSSSVSRPDLYAAMFARRAAGISLTNLKETDVQTRLTPLKPGGGEAPGGESPGGEGEGAASYAFPTNAAAKNKSSRSYDERSSDSGAAAAAKATLCEFKGSFSSKWPHRFSSRGRLCVNSGSRRSKRWVGQHQQRQEQHQQQQFAQAEVQQRPQVAPAPPRAAAARHGAPAPTTLPAAATAEAGMEAAATAAASPQAATRAKSRSTTRLMSSSAIPVGVPQRGSLSFLSRSSVEGGEALRLLQLAGQLSSSPPLPWGSLLRHSSPCSKPHSAMQRFMLSEPAGCPTNGRGKLEKAGVDSSDAPPHSSRNKNLATNAATAAAGGTAAYLIARAVAAPEVAGAVKGPGSGYPCTAARAASGGVDEGQKESLMLPLCNFALQAPSKRKECGCRFLNLLHYLQQQQQLPQQKRQLPQQQQQQHLLPRGQKQKEKK